MILTPQEVEQNRNLVINGADSPRICLSMDNGICAEAISDVVKVIESGTTCYWRGGPKTHELEQKFAALIGRKAAFFHNSGSAALLTGLYALGADENSVVAISSSGFVASLNAVYHARSRPVFLPTCPSTLVVESDVSQWVEEPVDVLLVTQFFGNVIDIDRVRISSKTRFVLEDASQALGSQLNGQMVGAHGDVATFAGSQKKLLGSGTGGINVYDNPEFGERMRILAHHGKGETQYADVPGFNFFGGELEATLALAALARLLEKVALRQEAAQRMIEVLKSAGLQCASPPSQLKSDIAWFDVGIILPPIWTKLSRDWLVKALQLEGVPAWYYPALIDMPWVKPWMSRNAWWGEREETLLIQEKALWDRVFVIATQISPNDAERCAEIVAELLTNNVAAAKVVDAIKSPR